MDNFYKISDVAQKLGVHRATLKRWIKTGKGPVFSLTPGGHYLFRESDVLEWQEQLRTCLET